MTFAEQVVSHRRRLLAYAITLCRDGVKADDLVSETIVKALSHGPADHPDLLGWLLLVLRNLHIDQRRKQATRREEELHEDWEGSADPEQFWHAVGPDIVAALSRLQPREQRAVLMVCHEGQSYADVCAALNVSLAALKCLLHRAKRRLQELLSDDFQTEGPRI